MKKFIPILLLAGSTFLAGCGDSGEEFVFTNTNGLVAPVARNDAYTTAQNTAVSIPAGTGVLANDTLNGTNVTVTFPATTAQGGTVTFGANTGAFTYTPANGFQGVDSFTYTLSNGFGTSSATVSITVGAVVPAQGIFVDSVNGNDATGNAGTGAPFRTIQAAVTAAGANTDIVVRPGNYTGAINLLNGQRLLGSGSALVNAQGVQRPVLTGPVVLADGNTLDFLRIQGTAGDAIDGDDQNGGTVTNCEIANTTNVGSAFDAEFARGTWNISSNTISSVSGAGVLLSTTSNAEVRAKVNANTITGSAFNAMGFVSSGTSRLSVQADDNVMSGNQRGATFESLAGDSSVSTLQIVGNRNDDTYRFGVVSGSTAAIRVERLSQLIQLNNNTGTVTTPAGSQPATEIPLGGAGF